MVGCITLSLDAAIILISTCLCFNKALASTQLFWILLISISYSLEAFPPMQPQRLLVFVFGLKLLHEVLGLFNYI